MKTCRLSRAGAGALALLCVAGCSDSTRNLASDPTAPTDGSAATPDSGGPDPIASELCAEGVCACANGADDDGDGQADGFDPECTGPHDDDEETFATGIPGDNRDPTWQDCFYDGNSGAGNDGCRYHTDCLLGALDPGAEECAVSTQCLEYCRPRTPNGCDCFGCCSVQTPEGTQIDVVIGGDCTFETIETCQRCVPTQSECINECGRCELCLGKTPEDLPADCAGDAGTPVHSCEDGERVCDADNPCGAGLYCELGCCLVYVF